MSRLLERFGKYAAILVMAGATAAGILISPGTGVLVVVGALLVAVLAVGYLAIDALLSSDDTMPSAEMQEGEVATLRGEKASILQVLHDLEIERDMGKVSAADFEVLNRQFRGRAIELMKRIDRDLASYRKKAEALVAERVTRSTIEPSAAEAPPIAATGAAEAAGARQGCPGCGTSVDSETVFCKKCGRRVACAGCSAPLDPDSVFCKKCGSKVEANA
jgi:hypothetical protein